MTDSKSHTRAEHYTEPPPTVKDIAGVEAQLGYILPGSYIDLMRVRNGGFPANTRHPMSEPTSWAADHIAIEGVSGIGRDRVYSLCGDLGSQFHIDAWGYPPLGVYVASCPSAGHDLVGLDYRSCGPQGEPSVVHVDQERDFRITWVAPDFATFIAQLRPADDFRSDLPDLQA